MEFFFSVHRVPLEEDAFKLQPDIRPRPRDVAAEQQRQHERLVQNHPPGAAERLLRNKRGFAVAAANGAEFEGGGNFGWSGSQLRAAAAPAFRRTHFQSLSFYSHNLLVFLESFIKGFVDNKTSCFSAMNL